MFPVSEEVHFWLANVVKFCRAIFFGVEVLIMKIESTEKAKLQKRSPVFKKSFKITLSLSLSVYLSLSHTHRTCGITNHVAQCLLFIWTCLGSVSSKINLCEIWITVEGAWDNFVLLELFSTWGGPLIPIRCCLAYWTTAKAQKKKHIFSKRTLSFSSWRIFFSLEWFFFLKFLFVFVFFKCLLVFQGST